MRSKGARGGGGSNNRIAFVGVIVLVFGVLNLFLLHLSHDHALSTPSSGHHGPAVRHGGEQHAVHSPLLDDDSNGQVHVGDDGVHEDTAGKKSGGSGVHIEQKQTIDGVDEEHHHRDVVDVHNPPPTSHKTHKSHHHHGHHYTVDKKAWPYDDLEHMVKQRTPKKRWVPHPTSNKDEYWEALQQHQALFDHTGCNLEQVPFEAQQDAKCIEYLSDPENWEELIPLAQEYDQRTIKFKINYKAIEGTEMRPKSILKVPQRLFPNEAFSEVGAYHADRVLHVNRIPPTGWVCIPTTMIHASVAKHGPTMETVEDFLKESGVKNFQEWIEKDLFQYTERIHAIRNDEKHGECIGASIQLHMADVAHLLDSHLKIPYIPHNASWHRYYNLKEQHDDEHRPIFYEEKYMPSLIHIAEVSAYDFVIGNGDRSPNKNNFVVGGCKRSQYCGKTQHHGKGYYLPHFGHPTYVHLDQGMGFYDVPKNNPITKAIRKQREESESRMFCLFRAPMLERMMAVLGHPEDDDIPAKTPFIDEKLRTSDGGKLSIFHVEMAKRLPVDISRFLTSSSLKACTKRLEKLLAWANKCLGDDVPWKKYMLTP